MRTFGDGMARASTRSLNPVPRWSNRISRLKRASRWRRWL
jgi:hypothetical protein